MGVGAQGTAGAVAKVTAGVGAQVTWGAGANGASGMDVGVGADAGVKPRKERRGQGRRKSKLKNRRSTL